MIKWEDNAQLADGEFDKDVGRKGGVGTPPGFW
jgi:hypothetical protein